MGGTDNRQIARDSLFVLVDLRIDGEQIDHRIKMRNLSAGGMMAEGSVRAMRGMVVWVNLRNIGWTEGTIAWVQDNRFGIAFRDEIDPKLARAAQSAGAANDSLLIHRPFAAIGSRRDGPLRKI
ncbi:PilZ domain-containing protein [Novosphingobium sp. TH158]|uniref:PilZ domain-containing protein n=1 Tax=Novosphingobium sp. TH158 TaxID=2067455 RepID=UPI000C79D670|nr:PilZ domain-containing protein [Novosphingobium sp. TH158]PLK27393.1 pilus assembly protein PilZ [Novosphingobium sp. TH158]